MSASSSIVKAAGARSRQALVLAVVMAVVISVFSSAEQHRIALPALARAADGGAIERNRYG